VKRAKLDHPARQDSREPQVERVKRGRPDRRVRRVRAVRLDPRVPQDQQDLKELRAKKVMLDRPGPQAPQAWLATRVKSDHLVRRGWRGRAATPVRRDHRASWVKRAKLDRQVLRVCAAST
jgi:hypothetical protein